MNSKVEPLWDNDGLKIIAYICISCNKVLPRRTKVCLSCQKGEDCSQEMKDLPYVQRKVDAKILIEEEVNK